MFEDIWGNEVTAANEEAVEHLNSAILSYMGLRNDPGDHLKAALAADPNLVFGHVMRGYFFLLMANRRLLPRAMEALRAAEAAEEKAGATSRERAHMAVLEVWLRGDLAGALMRWATILIDSPRDPVAIKLSEFWHFYFGDSPGLRNSVGRVLHAWHDGVPGFGFILGIKAFALEECGDYAAAEAEGRRAVESNPEDVWAAHAVAHVMEMTGRLRDGIDWITGLEDNFHEIGNFIHHVWWHRALFHYEMGDYVRALQLYDNEIRPESTSDYLDITNAASMLWRFELEGVKVGNRWNELIERAAERTEDHMLVFADAHYMMALARAENSQPGFQFLASAKAFAADGAETQGLVMRDAGYAMCDAILAFGRGDFGRAVDLMLNARAGVRAIGGSHAQRDVFELTLVHAAIRDRQLGLARALLSERTFVRPNSPRAWSTFGELMNETGDREGARAVLTRSMDLVRANLPRKPAGKDDSSETQAAIRP